MNTQKISKPEFPNLKRKSHIVAMATIVVLVQLMIVTVLIFTLIFPMGISIEASHLLSVQNDIIPTRQLETDITPDPDKVVTDPFVLDNLQKMNIDHRNVEFTADYGQKDKNIGNSPTTQIYTDLKTGERIAIISTLPYCRSDGTQINVGWELKSGNVFNSKTNLFIATVNNTEVAIVTINDQFDGRKDGDTLIFNPQLFLDGKEILPKTTLPSLVDDPGGNYIGNILEWDYGICKRWLRIIQGRVYGSWIFNSNPNGEATFKYNQSGEFRLTLDRWAISDDEESVPQSFFDDPDELPNGYPLTIRDETTFDNPSVDGDTRHVETTSWANIRAGAGDYVTNNQIFIGWRSAGGSFNVLYRGIVVWDTSSLEGTVSAATLSMYYYASADAETNSPENSVQVVSASPASDTALAAGDFDSLGGTAFSTAIDRTDWSAGYNAFVLNANGLANINVDTYSRFGFIDEYYDLDNTEDPDSDGYNQWTYIWLQAEEAGSGKEPKLVVTYGVCSPNISEAQSSYAFGTVAESGTPTTGLTYFTVTNSSGGAVSITIGATDMTGVGTDWTLSDTATAGADIYGLKAGTAAAYNIIVKKTAAYNNLIEGLANSGTQSWGLQMYAPTSFSNGNAKSGTVTLTATCD